MPFVQRPHTSLYYESHGEGEPIVFAHGAGGNTLIWWQQIPHFARSRRVLSFDHRGFGRSLCEPGHFHAREFAADLFAILDHAGVERAAQVRVRALDAQGEAREIEAEDLLAVCIQHEMDHLLGKVFVDYLSPLKRNRIKAKLLKAEREDQKSQGRPQERM